MGTNRTWAEYIATSNHIKPKRIPETKKKRKKVEKKEKEKSQKWK